MYQFPAFFRSCLFTMQVQVYAPQKSKCCISSTLNQVFILFLRISPGDADPLATLIFVRYFPRWESTHQVFSPDRLAHIPFFSLKMENC